ncbi:MAG: LysR family transcriptional regulator [Alphaproteobacteria bacterium]
MHHVALKFVETVERFGSIRAAARHLNVATSSITRQIQNLEYTLGVQLFERSSDGVVLTDAGEAVLAHIKRTLRDLERTKTQIEAIAGRRATVIRIMTTDSVASSFLPVLLSEYLSERPGVRFKVSIHQSDKVWREMQASETDIGINFLPIDVPDIDANATYELELGIACARDHPVASQEIVTLSEALAYPMVAASVAAPVYDEVRRLIQSLKHDIQPWIETNSTSMIKNLVETGRFVSIRTVLFSIGYDVSSLRTVWRPLDKVLPADTLIVGSHSLVGSSEEVSNFIDYTKSFLDKSLS